MKEIIAVSGQVSASSNVVTITSGYEELAGITVDGSGNVFFTDFKQAVVYKIATVNGVISSASPVTEIYGNIFSGPTQLKVDASGNIYLCDSSGQLFELKAVNGVVSSSSDSSVFISGSDMTDIAFNAAGTTFLNATAGRCGSVHPT